MKTYLSRRIPVVVAAGLALAVLALAFPASASPGAPNPGHAWTELENHGTSGAPIDTYWLGTTADQALELRVNNERALRLEPASVTPNIIGGYGGNSVTPGVAAATIAGGGYSGAPCGDCPNRVTDDAGTVGGGTNNQAGNNAGTLEDAWVATVGGGSYNTASGEFSTVGGGLGNEAAAAYATVSGGGESSPGDTNTRNRVTDDYGTIGGGGNNQAGDAAGDTSDAPYNTVGGGEGNIASASYTHVLPATGHATVGGGQNNTASGPAATVGGGSYNTASQWFATVAGGATNTASSYRATVGGGGDNTASGVGSTVGGGLSNTAWGAGSTVGGGQGNDANGVYATVPGGLSNTAGGHYSFAAGRRATAISQGCFVWGDSSDTQITCEASDAFMVQAGGGVDLYSSSDLSTWCYLAPGGNSWSCSSDRNLKENFQPVDEQEVLAALAEVPISTWNMKAQDDSIRHMGPVAQDFYAAFGLGESDTSIGTADADGVALAAIQGLYQLSQEQAARIDALEKENAALQQRLDDLESRVSALEAGPGVSAAVSQASSSGLPAAWLLLGGGLALVLGGLVLAQRRLMGGGS
jgi:hypothetical protein